MHKINEHRRLYFEAKYFYWKRDAKIIRCKIENFSLEFNRLCRQHPEKMVTGTNVKTRVQPWLEKGDGAWRYEKKGCYEYIYLYRHQYPQELYIYTTNSMDDGKNTNEELERGKQISNGEYSGTKALKYVKEKFKEETNSTFQKAFGTVPAEYKKYVPRQFYFQNTSGTYKNVSGADYCSHYPSNMRGILPDSHTAIELNGVIEPTEEYPFAFYPDSGHLAIYNEFSTRNWLKTEFKFELFRTNAKETEFVQNPYVQDTKTILMKASKYELTSIYNKIYDMRLTALTEEENKLRKAVSNKSIGTLHTKKYTSNKYAHLAAVCIARANNKMLNVASIIGKRNIIQICVDGIIYLGNRSIGTQIKALGNLNQEFINGNIRYDGANKYIVEDQKHNIIKVKHAGCLYNSDGTAIDENNIKNIDELNNWDTFKPGTTEREKFIKELIWQIEN